jgi:hypothetical protein
MKSSRLPINHITGTPDDHRQPGSRYHGAAGTDISRRCSPHTGPRPNHMRRQPGISQFETGTTTDMEHRSERWAPADGP